MLCATRFGDRGGGSWLVWCNETPAKGDFHYPVTGDRERAELLRELWTRLMPNGPKVVYVSKCDSCGSINSRGT